MLYTLSCSQSNMTDLEKILSNLTNQDALVLWQDGILQAVRYPQVFTKIDNLFVLEQDLLARGLNIDQLSISHICPINLSQLIDVTDKYYPQITL